MSRRSNIPNASGVYLIRNLVKTDDFYIGSATNLRVRRNKHLARLRHNIHEACYLQNAFHKYGEENFAFEILEIMPITYDGTRRDEEGYYASYMEGLWAREQHHMDALNPVYNYLKTAGTNIGAMRPDNKAGTFGIWWNNLRACWIVRYMNQSRGQFVDLEEAKIHLAKVKLDPSTPNPPDDRSGVVKSEEEIAKLRERMMGNTYGKGQVKSAEQRARSSALQKGVPRPYAAVPCPPERAAKIKAAQAGKPREWQRGKPSKPSKSGHFGIGWRADSQKWMVRLNNKKYGSYDTLEEAIVRRDQILKGEK